MNILIMNDYFTFGGTEVQTLREKKILEDNKHNVLLVTFDRNMPYMVDETDYNQGHINIPLKFNKKKAIINACGFKAINKKLLKELEKIFLKFKPDLVHINNINIDPITVYTSLTDKKVIQTIRDYSAICPKATCIKLNGEVCSGSSFNNCSKICNLKYKKFILYKFWENVISLRKNIVKFYIAPSKKLTELCTNNYYNIKCINNPFDFEKYNMEYSEKDFNECYDNKKYLYYGNINKEKGILELIVAFKEFCIDKDVELIIAGEVLEDIKDVFYEEIEHDNINYVGKLEYNDMLNLVKSVYAIVVPSIWMENYPNTVLEGLCLKKVVLGSDRGGIPEMLDDGRGFIFDVLEKDDIVYKLEYSYNLSYQDYLNMINKGHDYTFKNNSFENYYHSMVDYFNSI